MANERMTEEEYQRIKEKVLYEYPIRVKLAKKLGIKLNDQTIAELEALETQVQKVINVI